MFCLWGILGHHEVNLATILVDSFSRPKRGGASATLDLGPFVTRIARHLGVFDRFAEVHLTRGIATEVYDLEDLQKSGMVTFTDPPAWEPTRRPSYQMVVPRHERPHEPRPDPEPRAISSQTRETSAGSVTVDDLRTEFREFVAEQRFREDRRDRPEVYDDTSRGSDSPVFQRQSCRGARAVWCRSGG